MRVRVRVRYAELCPYEGLGRRLGLGLGMPSLRRRLGLGLGMPSRVQTRPCHDHVCCITLSIPRRLSETTTLALTLDWVVVGSEQKEGGLPRIKLGSRVLVEGLVARPELNGEVGSRDVGIKLAMGLQSG